MADDFEELASTPALLLDEFTTYSMTGWLPRCGSGEFNTLTLLRRRGRFLLQVTHNQRIVDDIWLDDVITYVIKVWLFKILLEIAEMFSRLLLSSIYKQQLVYT